MNTDFSADLMIPIAAHWHTQARQFAATQITPKKGVQVYLNTLAIRTVHCYLESLNITTDVSLSEGWQPGLQSLFNTADLLIPQVGRLECLVFLPEVRDITIAPEIQGQRFGAVGVEFNATLTTARLLGFVQACPELPSPLARSRLDSLDLLLQRCSTPVVTRLAAWLRQEFDQTWQDLQNILSPAEPGLALRNVAIARGKTLPWAILGLNIQPEAGAIRIQLRVEPRPDRDQLPADLMVQLITANGEIFETFQGEMTAINYTFRAAIGEQFSLRLQAEGTDYIEDFQA
jgi:hypothetical protein